MITKTEEDYTIDDWRAQLDELCAELSNTQETGRQALVDSIRYAEWKIKYLIVVESCRV